MRGLIWILNRLVRLGWFGLSVAVHTVARNLYHHKSCWHRRSSALLPYSTVVRWGIRQYSGYINRIFAALMMEKFVLASTEDLWT